MTATIAKTEWLLGFACSAFGDTPIKAVDARTILDVLRAVEVRGRYESARRLRSTIGSVFRYAIATARADVDPTYALRGALTQVKATPRAAITNPTSFGALLRAIDAFDGQPGTRFARLRCNSWRYSFPALASFGLRSGANLTSNAPSGRCQRHEPKCVGRTVCPSLGKYSIFSQRYAPCRVSPL